MKLKEIVRESRETFKGDMAGVPVVGLEHIIPEEILFSEYEVDCDKTFSKAFYKGQVLFGRRRAYQKKAAVAHVDGVCSGDIMVLEAIPGKMEPTLLPFVIQNDKFFDYAIQHSEGGLSPRVKWSAIANYELNLPSLDEQKVLADKLWAAYRVKESYRKLLAATDDMVKAKFVEMFGDPMSSAQKYEIKSLGECCTINPRRSAVSLLDTDKVSFVPMPAVSENGYIDGASDVDYGTVKKGFTYFENGDVLFAKITPCMENGKGAIAQNLTNGVGMGSTEFHILRPMNGVSNEYWLLCLTRLPQFRAKARKNMTGTGGQLRVSSTFLTDFPIGLPPIAVQEQFALVFTQAEATKASLRQSIDSIDRVIKSLINQ